MRKVVLVFFIVIATSNIVKAQDVGLSFSFFFPKNGDFSTPISPFSIRGLGVNITNFLGVQTGASLYRMTGMNVKGLPFESQKPIMGPNFTLLIPAEVVIQLGGDNLQLNLKGGGFFFYSFDQKLNYGNLDRAIRDYENWSVVNSQFNFDNRPGFGYMVGGEFIVYLSNGYGVSLEGNYLVGGSTLNLNGQYSGYSSTTNTYTENQLANYDNSQVDFTGIEVSIGIIMSGGGGSRAPKRNKRRRR